MVTLFQQTGQSIQISDRFWGELLAEARSCGWQPAGTQCPPILFDLDQCCQSWASWDRDCYERPEGQVVGKADSIRLAEAIHKAAAMPSTRAAACSNEAIEIAQFCANGGFLISTGSPLLDEHIDSVQSLYRLASALGGGATSPVETSTAATAASRLLTGALK